MVMRISRKGSEIGWDRYCIYAEAEERGLLSWVMHQKLMLTLLCTSKLFSLTSLSNSLPARMTLSLILSQFLLSLYLSQSLFIHLSSLSLSSTPHSLLCICEYTDSRVRPMTMQLASSVSALSPQSALLLSTTQVMPSHMYIE